MKKILVTFFALLLIPAISYGADITKAHTWVDGETPTAALMNGNEDPVYSTINDLDADNLAADIAITTSGNAIFTGTVTASSTVGVGTSCNPDASDGATLGTTALEWSDAYIADEGVIYFGDDQEIPLTHVADTGLLIALDDKLMFGDTAVYIMSDDDGHLDLEADTSIDINGPWTAASQTCANLGTVTTADINAGTVDATIGATTPAAGTFAALTSNAATIIGDAPADTLHVNADTITFEGPVADANDTTFTFTTQTSARTITFPNSSGTILYTDTVYTNSAQPAFSAVPASAQTSFVVGSAVTVVFGTEIFDQASNFATNTFTAPTTGRYQLNVALSTTTGDSASTTYVVNIVTSNRSYAATYDSTTWVADATNWSFVISVLADMDTSDTAYVTINQASGTQQTNITTESYFNGFLAT